MILFRLPFLGRTLRDVWCLGVKVTFAKQLGWGPGPEMATGMPRRERRFPEGVSHPFWGFPSNASACDQGIAPEHPGGV